MAPLRPALLRTSIILLLSTLPPSISTRLFLASPNGFSDHFVVNGSASSAAFNGRFGGTPILGLQGRQEQTCTLPEPWFACPNGENCCEDGDVCCPDVCCPDSSYCYGDDRCCPNGSQTCGKGFCLAAGQQCCGDNSCKVGFDCVEAPDGTALCCYPEEIACNDGTCCPEGSTCYGDGLCQDGTSPPEETESPEPSPTPTPAPPANTPSEPQESSEEPAFPTFTFPSAAASSSTTSSATPSCTPPSKRALPFLPSIWPRQSGGSGDYLLINGQCLPVMDFASVPGLTDQLVASMCQGIQIGGGTNYAVLTWAGDGTQGANQRRRASGCPGHCSGQTDSSGARLECDEFPPASTLEGGSGASKMCIVWWQNSGLQGPMIRYYAQYYSLQAGSKFVIRITSGCGKSGGDSADDEYDDNETGSDFSGSQDGTLAASDLSARSASSNPDNPTSQPISGTNTSTLTSNYNIYKTNPLEPSQQSTGFLIAPIGTAASGAYNATLSLTDTTGLPLLYVIGGDGIEYWSTNLGEPGLPISASWDVYDGGDELSVVGDAFDGEQGNVTYTATVAPLPPSATATGQLSGTVRGMALMWYHGADWEGALLVSCIVGFVGLGGFLL